MRKWTTLFSLLLLAACAVPRPLFFLKSSEPRMPARTDSQRGAVRAALERYYPRLVRSGSGYQTVLFVTNSTGQIERTDMLWNAPPEPGVDLLFRRFADLPRDSSLIKTGVTVFEAGEIGPAKLIVVWGERQAEGKQKGPYRFAGAGT